MNKKTSQNFIKQLYQQFLTKRNAAIMLFCLLATGVVTCIRPIIIKNITDQGMLQSNFHCIVVYSILLLSTSVLDQIAYTVQSYRFVVLQNQITSHLYESAFHKIIKIRDRYFDRYNSSEIIQAIFTDVNAIAGVADRGVLFFISFALSIVGGTIGLVVLNWKMALLVIAIVPLKMVLSYVLSHKQERYTEQQLNLRTNFSAWFGEVIGGIREIKLWNIRDNKFKEFQMHQDMILKNNKNSSMCDSYNQTLTALLDATITSMLYMIGGYILVQGNTSLGSVLAFITYANYVTGPISSLLYIRYLFARIRPSVSRLSKFLNETEETNKGNLQRAPAYVQSIRIENLSFSYHEDFLLNKINFEVKSGQRVAIIGANGAGKSTLIKILLRFEDAAEGGIYIDDIEACEYQMEAYREMFSVVNQSSFLFQESLRYNIDLKGEHSEAEIQETIRNYGLQYMFLERYHENLKGMVFQNGKNLSGGERKKISTARAFIKNAPIIIMDEVASEYDIESEDYLNSILKTELSDKILIYITHDYRHLSEFDCVFELKDGNLRSLSKAAILDKEYAVNNS